MNELLTNNRSVFLQQLQGMLSIGSKSSLLNRNFDLKIRKISGQDVKKAM